MTVLHPQLSPQSHVNKWLFVFSLPFFGRDMDYINMIHIQDKHEVQPCTMV